MEISLRARPFQLARMVAQNADSFPHRIRVGSVITKRSGVLSTACNRDGVVKISVQGKRRSFLGRHAEVRAIKQAGLDAVQGATIWVWREVKNGTPAFARPCDGCMELLRISGVKRVVYTISTAPFFAEERIS